MNLPYIPRTASTHPAILITGFLGAGKTTLLRELLKSVQKANLLSDVILNDYADASLDSATLQEYSESVEPLTATCACCEGLDFLLDLSVKSSKSTSDILFIELNGTADPLPVIESFTLLEEKLLLHPRWQICVIDPHKLGNRGSYSDIEELQLQTASHIYFSHAENADLTKAINKIKEVNPYASIVDKITLIEQVINLAQKKTTRLITRQANQAEQADHATQTKQQTDILSKIAKSPQHQKTHEFTSCKILMPDSTTEETLKHWLRSLPPNVIRAKLIIRVAEKKNDRYLYERVGTEVSNYFQKVNLHDSVPNSAILIGPNLNIQHLEESAQKAFSS